MSDTNTIESLAAEVRQRLDALADKAEVDGIKGEVAAIRDSFSDTKIEEMVRGFLASLDGDDEAVATVRKLVFGREGSPGLVGSKYRGMTVADIEFMHDMLESAHAVRVSKAGPSEELRNAVKVLSERAAIPQAVAQAEDLRKIEELRASGHLDRAGYANALSAIRQVYGAMDTAETGYGLEIIGAQYVSELWAGARASSRVFQTIPTFQMTDATAYLPVEAGVPEMLFVGESTASNSSNYTTSKTGSNRVQVTPYKFVIHQMWSGEMEEDSIIPFVPFLRAQAARSLGFYTDSLVLNGDTTNAGTGNINLDDADPADTKHYLAFDGIRHAALVDNTANDFNVNGALTFDVALNKPRQLMLDRTYLHDWGHPNDPNDLVYVADPETADAISLFDEVVTVDKLGPAATVLTGQLAKIGPHPLIPSIAMSKTEADGKVSTTGSNNTKGQVAAYNRGGFVAGWRRQVKVETERIPATDQSRVVYSLRLGFGRFTPTGAASGIEAAATLRGISL